MVDVVFLLALIVIALGAFRWLVLPWLPRLQQPRAVGQRTPERGTRRVSSQPPERVRIQGSGQNGRVRVEADARPLWMIRGWRRQGNRRLIGAFRTQSGACAGLIVLGKKGWAQDYYLVNPPQRLLAGSHGPCFRPRGGEGDRLYWVHFSRAQPDIDSGIVAVEALLREALVA